MELRILSEFLGTMVLIMLGNGVGASVSYKRMFGNQPGKWVVITFAWGLAVLMGVIVSQALGGYGHLNPAVSLFAYISGSIGVAEFFAYAGVQLAGAMVGQLILNLLNFKHIKETDAETVLGCHSTGPAFSNFKEKGVFNNFAYELVGTLMLIGVIFALGKGSNGAVLSGVAGAKMSLGAVGALPVTLLIVSIGMSLGSSTGYAINPVRDFGPRLVFWFWARVVLKNKEVSINWSYAWVPVVAPMVAGAIIGGIALAV